MSNIVKVNWYEEELDKFYSTCKNNNGYIHGIYYFNNEEQDYTEVFWYKSIEERDKIFAKDIEQEAKDLEEEA